LQKWPNIVSLPCDSSRGFKPVYVALQFKQYSCLELLLQYSADIYETEDSGGLTFFMIAVLHHDIYAFQTLFSYLPAALPVALEMDEEEEEIITRVKEEDPLLTTFSQQKRSLLYMIIEHDQLEIFFLMWQRYFPSGSSFEENKKWKNYFFNELLIEKEKNLTVLHVICGFDRSSFLSYLLLEQEKLIEEENEERKRALKGWIVGNQLPEQQCLDLFESEGIHDLSSLVSVGSREGTLELICQELKEAISGKKLKSAFQELEMAFRHPLNNNDGFNEVQEGKEEQEVEQEEEEGKRESPHLSRVKKGFRLDFHKRTGQGLNCLQVCDQYNSVDCRRILVDFDPSLLT
jgi:hypothetical protein